MPTMMGTTPGEVHVEAVLSQYAQMYRVPAGVADAIFPRAMVKKESDFFPKWEKGDMLREDNDVHADRSETPLEDYATDRVAYLCEEHRRKTSITPRERENSANELDLEKGKTSAMMNRMQLRRERLAMQAATGATVPHRDVTVAFNAASGTKIISDLEDSKYQVFVGTGGLEATDIIIPRSVAQVIMLADEVRDLVKYTDPSLLVAGMLPQELRGLKVHIGRSIATATKKGQATQTFAEVWNDCIVVVHNAPNPSAGEPSFGYTPTVKTVVEQWWEGGDVKADYYKAIDLRADGFIVSVDCAYRLDKVLTKSA